MPAGVAGMVCRKVAMGGGGDGGISGGIGGGVVDWLGRLPGEGVAGDSVGGEKGGASSNTAAAGSVGGRGCDTAIENGPVAKDSEGGEDSRIGEVGVEPCGEGDGKDGDLRGKRRRLISFSPFLSNSTLHRLFVAFRVRFASGM